MPGGRTVLPLNDVLATTPPTDAQIGYLAGIMDGEGYFVGGERTNSFGLRVAMIDQPVIERLAEWFGGNATRGGLTVAGNRVFVWYLSRQADLLYLLPRLHPLLVCKAAQASAMLDLIAHLDAPPAYATPTSRAPRAERARRRGEREEWRRETLRLRAAVRTARRP